MALGIGMKRMLHCLVLTASAITATGCSMVHSAWMWFPKLSGMDEVTPQLFVEPTMPAEQRQDVQRQIDIGRAQVERFYGSITTTPYFVACISRECDTRFGSYGQRAAAYGDIAIRLSANGLSAPLVAHEWSHVEFYRRAGGWWHARKVPRWFDEGVAVVVANEARHSEANWRDIQRLGLPTPKLGELITFNDWGAAVNKYGETAGDVPSNLHVVYTTASQAVRGFLSCTGPIGIGSLLGALRAGATFGDAYAVATSECVH